MKQNEATRAAFAELSKALNRENGNDSDKYGKRPKYFSQEEWDLHCERMDALSDSDDDCLRLRNRVEAGQHLWNVSMWNVWTSLRMSDAESTASSRAF